MQTTLPTESPALSKQPGFFKAFRQAGRGMMLLSPAVLMAALLAPLGPAPVLAQEATRNELVVALTNRNSNLELTEKATRILELKTRIKSVEGFDPAVVGVTPVTGTANQIRVVGQAPGVTTVVLIDEKGDSYSVEILVSGDVKHVEAIIRQAYPDSSVRAIKVGDAVLLHGWVNQPDQLTTIVEIAERFFPKVINSLRVSGVQQVLLRVKIMEVQRNRIRQLGFNFLELRDAGYLASQIGQLTPLTSLTAPFGGPPTAAMNTTGATAAFGIIDGDNVFQGFIEALKQEALLKVLAEPNIVAVNGRPANFLSGGEFPILIPQGLGTISVQFKSFGVSVEFVPNVMGNGRLKMDIRPEVSEKDFTNTVTVGNTTVPGLTTRRVQTQVEMSFGQTLVCAGLISNRIQSRTQKIPFLGELPWVGAAFRRVLHDESETELLIMVTPEPASPLDQMPPGGPGTNSVSPTDRELYFNGYLETPRFGPDPDCDNCPPGYQSHGDPAGGYNMPPQPAGVNTPLPPPLPNEPITPPSPGTVDATRTLPRGLTLRNQPRLDAAAAVEQADFGSSKTVTANRGGSIYGPADESRPRNDAPRRSGIVQTSATVVQPVAAAPKPGPIGPNSTTTKSSTTSAATPTPARPGLITP